MYKRQLKGRPYEPLFDFAQKRKPSDNAWKIYNDEYVSDESGTGLVHLACFGEDDVRIFNREGIPIFDPVDEEGNFMQDMEFIAGLNVMEANRPISQKLKEKGLMFRQETVEHSYPFCWRTDTPLTTEYRSASRKDNLSLIHI